VPSQPLLAGVGLTGTSGEQVGCPFGVLVHLMFAFSPLSMNLTLPPGAIVTLLAGEGLPPGDVQQGQLG